jgi:ABC-2 type transport system ATP-binding protein
MTQAHSVILKIDGITKLHGQFKALNTISLNINRGEIFGLLGPNGAGKSTLLSILAGCIKPTTGIALLDDVQIQPTNLILRARIGLVPQDFAFYEDLTAKENLLFFGQLFGLDGQLLTNKVNEILQIIGLDDGKADQYSKYFSGGMKRRLNLGIALVHSPDVLMLDEPTVGVDPQSRNRIFEAIKTINSTGTTVIYTTHYMEEAESLCNRIAILDHGEIIACDTLQNLLSLTQTTIKFSIIENDQTKTGILKEKLPTLKPDTSSGTYSLTSHKNPTPDIINLLVNEKIQIINLHMDSPNLEKVFLSLTGRHLRD